MDLNDFPLLGSNEPTRSDLSAPSLQDAITLLIAHEYALCRGDEDTADELLADLEPHLRRLDWAQNEWLRGLSGDLHMLNNEEVLESNPYSSSEYGRLIAEAWVSVANDPDSLLRLLRFETGENSRRLVWHTRVDAPIVSSAFRTSRRPSCNWQRNLIHNNSSFLTKIRQKKSGVSPSKNSPLSRKNWAWATDQLFRAVFPFNPL